MDPSSQHDPEIACQPARSKRRWWPWAVYLALVIFIISRALPNARLINDATEKGTSQITAEKDNASRSGGQREKVAEERAITPALAAEQPPHHAPSDYDELRAELLDEGSRQ